MEELVLFGEKYWLTISLGIVIVLIFLIPPGRKSTQPHQRIRNIQERRNQPRRENKERQKEKVTPRAQETKRSVAESSLDPKYTQKTIAPKLEASKTKDINGSQKGTLLGEQCNQQIIELITAISREKEDQLNHQYSYLKNRIVGQTVISDSKKQLYLAGAFLFLIFTKGWLLAVFLLLGVIVFLSFSIHWIDLYERGVAIRTFGFEQEFDYTELSEVCFVTYRYSKEKRQEMYVTFVTQTGKEIVENANQYYGLLEKLVPLLKEKEISITFINYQDGKLL